jgi:hypothetical protein
MKQEIELLCKYPDAFLANARSVGYPPQEINPDYIKDLYLNKISLLLRTEMAFVLDPTNYKTAIDSSDASTKATAEAACKKALDDHETRLAAAAKLDYPSNKIRVLEMIGILSPATKKYVPRKRAEKSIEFYLRLANYASLKSGYQFCYSDICNAIFSKVFDIIKEKSDYWDGYTTEVVVQNEEIQNILLNAKIQAENMKKQMIQGKEITLKTDLKKSSGTSKKKLSGDITLAWSEVGAFIHHTCSQKTTNLVETLFCTLTGCTQLPPEIGVLNVVQNPDGTSGVVVDLSVDVMNRSRISEAASELSKVLPPTVIAYFESTKDISE